MLAPALDTALALEPTRSLAMSESSDAILVLNAGSSSVTLAIFGVPGGELALEYLGSQARPGVPGRNTVLGSQSGTAA